MKKLNINILCTLFLLLALASKLPAQTNGDDEIYYSNPQKGIKPDLPKAYHDSSIVSKTDDLTVELIGVVPDTNPRHDSLRFKSLSSGNHSGFENPGYWGANIIYSWDPWYSPYYNTWYHPGWGGSHWMLSYGWGSGPYWSFGLGWNWGYGWVSPWCVWDPFYYPYGYYYPYSYYAWYGWGYPYGYYGYGGYYGRSGYLGHRYLGSSARSDLKRNSSTKSGSAPLTGRGTVRRGGVDLNNGGRAPHGRVSGTATLSSRQTSSATSSRTTASYSNGRYAKPSSVATNRASQQAARISRQGASQSNYRTSANNSSSRTSFSNRSNSTRTYDNSSTRTSRTTYSNSSSSSSRSSNFNSGSSRSSSFGGGSSRSGGFSGGSSSRGGGGSHSSRR